MHERISLDDIGKAMFFSPTYCSAVFRRETGKSIINYILDEKVNEAKKLILEGVALTQVAEQVGFNDYNYFRAHLQNARPIRRNNTKTILRRKSDLKKGSAVNCADVLHMAFTYKPFYIYCGFIRDICALFKKLFRKEKIQIR